LPAERRVARDKFSLVFHFVNIGKEFFMYKIGIDTHHHRRFPFAGVAYPAAFGLSDFIEFFCAEGKRRRDDIVHIVLVGDELGHDIEHRRVLPVAVYHHDIPEPHIGQRGADAVHHIREHLRVQPHGARPLADKVRRVARPHGRHHEDGYLVLHFFGDPVGQEFRDARVGVHGQVKAVLLELAYGQKHDGVFFHIFFQLRPGFVPEVK